MRNLSSPILARTSPVSASPRGANNVPFKGESSLSTVKPSDLPELAKYLGDDIYQLARPNPFKQAVAVVTGSGFVASNILPFATPLQPIKRNDSYEPKTKNKYWEEFYFDIYFKADYREYDIPKTVDLNTQLWGPLTGFSIGADPRFGSNTSIDATSGGVYNPNGKPGEVDKRYIFRSIGNPGTKIDKIYDFQVYNPHSAPQLSQVHKY